MKNSKTTSHEEILTFLRHHPVAVLSTVSENGQPWGAAIYYLVDEEFNFYFVTRASTLKYTNLSNNPVAALTVLESETQTTVQASGKIHEVDPNEYLHDFFKKFQKLEHSGKQVWTPPIDKVGKGSNYIPLRLEPNRLQYANYGSKQTDFHAEYVEQIIPTP